MNTLITNPRGHRAAWVRRNPRSLLENGGFLSEKDLARFVCDVCMAPLDPDKPVKVLHGPHGMSVCEKCEPAGVEYERCGCEGCSNDVGT